MIPAVFDDLIQYIRFTETDAANLRALGPVVAPVLPRVADHFYKAALGHQETRALLSERPELLAPLRDKLLEWLRGLFGGCYDATYWAQRGGVGRAHVRAELPQRYMFAAMEIIWEELEKAVRVADVPDRTSKLRSLHKLLTLETAVMLEDYQASYSELVRHGERAAVHERLTRAEHLAQIGHLAASLAHEIKNPLAGISGAIQVIRDAMGADDPHRPIIAEILRQISRLDRTVKDLLVYARPKPPRFQRCNVKRAAERILTVLRKEPELQGLRIEHNDAQRLPAIDADEVQIEQLVMNLVLNAAHASAEDGVVRLTTTYNPRRIRLVVQDHGQGMDAEVCRRAFEPFYTTKAKGTGLGLPICQKIVEAHGGTIEIQSAVGKGTTVTVEFPRHARTTPEGQDE